LSLILFHHSSSDSTRNYYNIVKVLIKHTFLSIANGGEHSLPLRIIKKEEKEVSAVVELYKMGYE
jgi:hypothetical protein